MLLARLAIVCLLATGLGADTPDVVAGGRVDSEIRRSSLLDADLRTLCDEIGSRMSGTPGMRLALDWAQTAFIEAGLTNAVLEPVAMPFRWEEGDTRLEVIAPYPFPVRVAAAAKSPAVPESIEATLLDGGSGRPGAIAEAANRFREAVLLVELDRVNSFDDLAQEQRDAMVAMREAAEVGARAVLFVSTRPDQLLYRHVNSVSGRLDPIPSALVARSDGMRLLRLLRSGESIRIRLSMPNLIGEGYETANVVAEIPGQELPEEIVLLGAHLDSWDMGTGCMDNASNVALVVHVARSISQAGVRPRRTMRFVLFGGEEFGLFGSLAYADRHRPELDRHVATVVHDMGAGPVVGYASGGRAELVPRVESILRSAKLGGALRHTNEAYFISDNFTFALRGVPSLFAKQDTSGYFLAYHAESDTLDKVHIADVRDAASVAAALTLGIANLPERFGERLPTGAVRTWLRRARLDRHLRFLGVWDSWYGRAEEGEPGAE